MLITRGKNPRENILIYTAPLLFNNKEGKLSGKDEKKYIDYKN